MTSKKTVDRATEKLTGQRQWTILLCTDCIKKNSVFTWPMSDYTRRCDHRMKEVSDQPLLEVDGWFDVDDD